MLTLDISKVHFRLSIFFFSYSQRQWLAQCSRQTSCVSDPRGFLQVEIYSSKGHLPLPPSPPPPLPASLPWGLSIAFLWFDKEFPLLTQTCLSSSLFLFFASNLLIILHRGGTARAFFLQTSDTGDKSAQGYQIDLSESVPQGRIRICRSPPLFSLSLFPSLVPFLSVSFFLSFTQTHTLHKSSSDRHTVTLLTKREKGREGEERDEWGKKHTVLFFHASLH